MTLSSRHGAGRPESALGSGRTASIVVGDLDGRRSVRSQDLLGPGEELWIEHNSKRYRLRVTAQGKLILTA